MLLALIASVLIVFGAPYVGQIRGAIQSAFPAQYRFIVGGIVAVAVAAALASGVLHIRRWRRDRSAALSSGRHRPAVRYLLMAGALAIGAVYARAVASGNPDVDVVEAFHFVEYGIVTYLFYRASRHRTDITAVVVPLCAALFIGIADESVQWFVPGRVGELHDVLLNTVAIGCALLFSMAIHPPSSVTLPPTGRSRLVPGALAASLILAVAAFVDRVHLGVDVDASPSVTFRSQFPARMLPEVAAERSVKWHSEPPPTSGWAREDHYLSEGQWHVQARNLAERDRDLWTAWNENLILERFYPPVLDRGARWLPEQREQIGHAARETHNSRYVSAAAPYPIYVVSRAIFWPLILTSAALVIWMSSRGRVHGQP